MWTFVAGLPAANDHNGPFFFLFGDLPWILLSGRVTRELDIEGEQEMRISRFRQTFRAAAFASLAIGLVGGGVLAAHADGNDGGASTPAPTVDASAPLRANTDQGTTLIAVTTTGGNSSTEPTIVQLEPTTISVARAPAPMAPIITSPMSGTDIYAELGIDGQADVGSTVSITADGNPVCTTTADVDGNFSCTGTKLLRTGLHSISISSTLPNESPVVGLPIQVNAVTNPLIEEPKQGAWVPAMPTFSGLSAPGKSIALRDSRGTVLCTATPDDSGLFACSATAPMELGAVTVTAGQTASDELSATSDPRNYTVANGPILQSPVAGSVVGVRPVFQGTSIAGATVAILNQGGFAICTAVVEASGNFSCEPSRDLLEGKYEFVSVVTPPGGDVLADGLAGSTVSVMVQKDAVVPSSDPTVSPTPSTSEGMPTAFLPTGRPYPIAYLPTGRPLPIASSTTPAQELAITGSENSVPLMAGAGAILTGLTLVLMRRRRSSTH